MDYEKKALKKKACFLFQGGKKASANDQIEACFEFIFKFQYLLYRTT